MIDKKEDCFIPFIQKDRSTQRYYLTKEADNFLVELNQEQIGIICIMGPQGIGKTSILQRFLDSQDQQANLDQDQQTSKKTIGLQLSTKLLVSENKEFDQMKVLLIDSQGLEDNNQEDHGIYLFALLFSSYILYQIQGKIDESSLKVFNFVINLAKSIQVKISPHENDTIDPSPYFPSLLWIVRNFSEKLIDQEGNKFTSKEYLENFLKIQKGVSDSVEKKNRLRRLLKHYFQDRDCVAFKTSNPKQEWSEFGKLIIKRVLRKMRPKKFQGKPMNGVMIRDLCCYFLENLNQKQQINLERCWSRLCLDGQSKLKDEMSQLVNDRFSMFRDKYLGENELKQVKLKIKNEVMKKANSLYVGLEDE